MKCQAKNSIFCSLSGCQNQQNHLYTQFTTVCETSLRGGLQGGGVSSFLCHTEQSSLLIRGQTGRQSWELGIWSCGIAHLDCPEMCFEGPEHQLNQGKCSSWKMGCAGLFY